MKKIFAAIALLINGVLVSVAHAQDVEGIARAVSYLNHEAGQDTVLASARWQVSKDGEQIIFNDEQGKRAAIPLRNVLAYGIGEARVFIALKCQKACLSGKRDIEENRLYQFSMENSREGRERATRIKEKLLQLSALRYM